MPVFVWEYYEPFFYGSYLQDCAVIDRRRLSFVLRNIADTAQYDPLQEDLIKKTIVWHETLENGLRGGAADMHGSVEMFTTAVGTSDTLYVNGNGIVLLSAEDELTQERPVTECDGFSEETFFALTAKTVGDTAYICGHRGLVARRTGPGAWQNLSLDAAQFPGPPLTLLDIDGFAPDDLYAVAWGAGVVHYNGERWQRVPFPSNIRLESLCCGADGTVYVGGQKGTIFAGRGSRWSRVHEGGFTLPFHDMVWADDAVWCTNDYGVWTLRHGVFERAPVPDEIYFCSGHLSARADMVLLGGMNGACLYNGETWEVLYYQPEILAGLDDA